MECARTRYLTENLLVCTLEFRDHQTGSVNGIVGLQFILQHKVESTSTAAVQPSQLVEDSEQITVGSRACTVHRRARLTSAVRMRTFCISPENGRQ